jgi:4-hydroxybenzoate polyprenyltransferase
MAQSLWQRIRLTLDMIKFEHSVFALPFALTGALLAWRESGFQVEGAGWKLLWIVVAMAGARSAAMTFNRILDAEIDEGTRVHTCGISRLDCCRADSPGPSC